MVKSLLISIILLSLNNVFAKSNPWNRVETNLEEDAIVLGLPFKAGTELTLYISNEGNNLGKVVKMAASSSQGFKFGDLGFKSPINVNIGSPQVWLGSFNLGKAQVYYTELDSDVSNAVQITGNLLDSESIDGLFWEGNTKVSLFCKLDFIHNSCNVDKLSSWQVIYGTLAQDYELQKVQLLSGDLVYFQAANKRHQLLAFRSHSQFRKVNLVHDALEISASVSARGAIFNEKGFTTALYTKEGEKLLGIPLEERHTFGVASIEIHPNGEIHLSPQRGTSTIIDGFPLGVTGYETYTTLSFKSNGQLLKGFTLGEFMKGGILFRKKALIESGGDQFTIQLQYGGDNYEGVWAGEKVFMRQAKFTFSPSEKVIDLTGQNYINNLSYIQNMRDHNRVVSFKIQ